MCPYCRMGISSKAPMLPAAGDDGPAAKPRWSIRSVVHARPETGKERRFARSRGWYATFLVLALLVFFAVDRLTGLDVVAATSRFLWNSLALAANGATRAAGGLLALLAKGVGWRRLSRLATVVMGVGLSYSGGVILSDRRLERAKGWTGRLKALAATVRNRWLGLHLAWKLAIVAALIASQVYLHFLLILFPIAFLIPVVRRVWVRAADMLVGGWYWRALGRKHRAIVVFLRRLPGVRHAIGATRLTRIRYLRAWRLWRYDPRYRHPATAERRVSFVEPVRLWWRGDLDGYVGRHLLCGPERASSRGDGRD
jgi:hypothetical protein